MDALKRVINESADVIIPACGYIGALLAENNLWKVSESEVPILDIIGLLPALAELFAGIKKRTRIPVSKELLYASPPKDLIKNAG